MQTPPRPDNEQARLETLKALNILDTPAEERFDRITRLARRLFGVPITLVSLVDDHRQWFKSSTGLEATETPRDISFCGHAILGTNVMVVPDAALDIRFCDNPLVIDSPNIRFYAGHPLSAPNGNKLGTLCLLDQKPRTLGDEDRALLADLAGMVEHEIAAVQLAMLDELTQLANRRGFLALAQHALGVCKRLARPASLLFFDLTQFKQINDRYGHAEGDRALCAFAKTLTGVFRESDVLGRLGGDEFVVLLTDAESHEQTRALVRLDGALAALNARENRGYDVEYSVGTSTFNAASPSSITDLIEQADARMYENKKSKGKFRQPSDAVRLQ